MLNELTVFSWSVTPTFVVTIGHLRLEEPSKAAIYRPTHTVALFKPALNYCLLLHDYVDIEPDAVSEHFIKLLVCVAIFLDLCSSELAPEAFTATMAVLCQSSCTHCKLGSIFLPLFLLLGKDRVRLVKTSLELEYRWPCYVLRACRFPMP